MGPVEYNYQIIIGDPQDIPQKRLDLTCMQETQTMARFLGMSS